MSLYVTWPRHKSAREKAFEDLLDRVNFSRDDIEKILKMSYQGQKRILHLIRGACVTHVPKVLLD